MCVSENVCVSDDVCVSEAICGRGLATIDQLLTVPLVVEKL